MNPFLRHYLRKAVGLPGTFRKHPLLRKRMNPLVPKLHKVAAKATHDPLRTAIRSKQTGPGYSTKTLSGVLKRALRIKKPRQKRLIKTKIY